MTCVCLNWWKSMSENAYAEIWTLDNPSVEIVTRNERFRVSPETMKQVGRLRGCSDCFPGNT